MPLNRKIKTEIFENSIPKIKLLETESNTKAILTQYLQSQQNSKIKKDSFNDFKKKFTYKFGNEIALSVTEKELQQISIEFEKAPFPKPENYTFKFIDLFAGIGGFRFAMQKLGGNCVFTSEWDKEAQKTYQKNFGEFPFGDITKESTKKFIPDDSFDILCAGFPCQAFSIAGYQKGFSDTRGTLFFDVEQIIERHRPKAVFLENVKNLVSHNKGKTFKVILDYLENKLNYKVFYKVLNTMTHANIPQNRERIFIVAFDQNKVNNYDAFQFPKEVKLTKTIHDILEKEKQDDVFYYKKNHPYYPELAKTITSKDTVYQWRRIYVRENKSNVCPTLTANMGTGGHNVPLIKDDFGLRKLTPRECFSFQGYPKNYILPNIANSNLYKQAGNSVTTNLIERISKEIIKVL